MVFDQMEEDEKDLYLDVLKEGVTPFDRFVARGRMEDMVDIPGPRNDIDRYFFRAISQTQQDNSTRMIPIIGSAGTGKTHAFWAYKNIERKVHNKDEEGEEISGNFPEQWTIVYIPSPPAAVRILLHIYTCILDEMNSSETEPILKVVADKLVTRWGGKRKKTLGLFGGQDLEVTIQNGLREYPGIFSDCVKALCIYSVDKDRGGLAERWLLGEDLAEDELEILGINSVIESDDICLAMIKLICENSDKAVVLYIDELESPFRMHGPEAESKFLETLKQLYNQVKNLVLVLAVLKEIWPRILETADQAMRSRMEQERELQTFQFDDLKLYFAKAMEYFWNSNNLNPPIYPLFPFNEEVLQVIYNKTDGNQRSIIKLIRLFVDKIVYDEMPLEQIIKTSSEKPVKEKKEKKAKAAGKAVASAQEKSIIEKIEEMMADEDYTIEANPQSVAGASLKSIEVLAEKYGKEAKVTSPSPEFQVGKRKYKLAGIIEFEGKKFGLEIPSVRGFSKSGGVAAFYAAKRVSQALENGLAEKAILIVPEKTGGAKYKSLLNQFKDKIFVFEFNDDSAKFLIQQAMKQPSKDALNMSEVIFGELTGYESPIAPWEIVEEEVDEGSQGEAENATTESAVESEEHNVQ
ncbi:MAG: hypothetical protein ACTSUK_00940 [Promethearchaeota archaeon]